MANIKKIKNKISSIGKIKKITSAMQIVALTRLHKRQDITLGSRNYFEKIRELLFDVAKTSNFDLHPLLAKRQKTSPVAVIVVSSDKGLCGNFNVNIINKLQVFSSQHNEDIKVIAIGRKIIKFTEPRREYDVVNSYAPVNYDTLPEAVDKISKQLQNSFLKHKINSLFIIYNEFKKNLTGESKLVKLLPLTLETPEKKIKHRNYIYEPEPKEIFDELLKEYISNQIHQAVLESTTAEEMARMLAMKSASDNADSVIKKLNLTYHKARQTAITAELMDIVGAADISA